MDKLFGALSLCRRAGKLVAGYDAVCEAVLGGNATLVLFACDISTKTKRNAEKACEGLCQFAMLPYTKDELAVIVHKPAGILAVADTDFATLCRKAMPN